VEIIIIITQIEVLEDPLAVADHKDLKDFQVIKDLEAIAVFMDQKVNGDHVGNKEIQVPLDHLVQEVYEDVLELG
jgi:hypothetical protein